jgi:transposase
VPRAFSLDLRERVLAASRDDRLSHRAIAARFRVGESTVRGWFRRFRMTGALAAKPHAGGSRSKVDAAGAEVLKTLVDEQQDRTLAELAAGYRERTGVGLSVSAVCRACQRLDLRRKKKEPPRRGAGA